MHYIVLDLEWNQPMSAKSSVFNRLPIHLRGEVIEIGAVKLREDMTPGEEFQIYVKPVYFRKMHFKVKKLTGIDAGKLSGACGFAEAFEQFRRWCGDGCTFLTWGYDDRGILEQNIIIHDRDWDWIAGWVNLQMIYNAQVDGDNNQKSLSTAMEHFSIPQTRVAHDALGDAYNTALVCSHLDMAAGLAQYDETLRQLSLRKDASEGSHGVEAGPIPVEHLSFTGYPSRAAVFDAREVTMLKCPACGSEMETQKWVSQGDRRYMTLAECVQHGKYLARLKCHQSEDESWTVNRIFYTADSSMEAFYAQKAAKHRRHSRRSGNRKAEIKK